MLRNQQGGVRTPLTTHIRKAPQDQWGANRQFSKGKFLMTKHTDRWLLVPEAAEYMAMSEEQIRRLLLRGELRGVKVGKHWRTKTSWCDQHLMQGAN